MHHKRITSALFAAIMVAALSAPAQEADEGSVEINWEALRVLEEKVAPGATPQLIGPMVSPAAPPPKEQSATALIFVGTGERLTEESWSILKTMTESLTQKPVKIELEAYGGTPDDDLETAQRIAFRRGVALRRYFLERGIPDNFIRLDVKGLAEADAPPHRIDLFLATE